MIQVINIGTTANDGTGDTVRNAFDKVNDNFAEVSRGLYAQTALGTPVVYAPSGGQKDLIGTGVGSLVIPANTLKIGDSFAAKMCGNLTNTIGGAGVAELFANGSFTYNKDASNAIEGINFGLVSNTVFNTTVSNTLTITAEWITNNAANSIRSQNFTLTKVY